MAAFDLLQKAAFAGFIFPTSEIEVVGGLRDHVHEYPHSPGGAPEKLGRKLYEFRLKCPFYQGMKGYPLLWPETLASLRIIHEGGRSFDLVVPTVGTITAYCVSWTERANPRAGRNGVEVDLTYREDQSSLFLVDSLVSQSINGVTAAVPAFKAALADAISTPSALPLILPDPDIDLTSPFPPADALALQALYDIGAVLSDILLGIYEAVTVLEVATSLVSACETADATVGSLNQAHNSALLRAFRDLWAAGQSVVSDSLLTQTPVEYFTVPGGSVMSISEVSREIYGDNSHAIDLLKSNAIENAFAIRGGTRIKAYRTDLARRAA